MVEFASQGLDSCSQEPTDGSEFVGRTVPAPQITCTYTLCLKFWDKTSGTPYRDQTRTLLFSHELYTR